MRQFLDSIQDRIDNGEFDSYVCTFVPRKLIFSSIKNKLEKKVSNGGAEALTDHEVLAAIQDARETGAITALLFIKTGIIKDNTLNPKVMGIISRT